MGVTSIEWTTRSWNPIRGTKGRHICQRISDGCKNCYAATINRRFSRIDYVAGADVPRLDEKALREPLRWRSTPRCFVCSMTDLFWEAIPDNFIDSVFAVMAVRRDTIFQVLTKRAERMREYLSANPCLRIVDEIDRIVSVRGSGLARGVPWPLPNVHLGVSVEHQAAADERIPLLLQTPAAVRWVSYEPALGPVAWGCWLSAGVPQKGQHGVLGRALDWIVVGGESGPGARPFDLAWARRTVEDCNFSRTPCFVKQLGARPETVTHSGTVADGGSYIEPLRLRDRKGGDIAEFPDDLRVREFPK